jgi:hypothetical protein
MKRLLWSRVSDDSVLGLKAAAPDIRLRLLPSAWRS